MQEIRINGRYVLAAMGLVVLCFLLVQAGPGLLGSEPPVLPADVGLAALPSGRNETVRHAARPAIRLRWGKRQRQTAARPNSAEDPSPPRASNRRPPPAAAGGSAPPAISPPPVVSSSAPAGGDAPSPRSSPPPRAVTPSDSGDLPPGSGIGPAQRPKSPYPGDGSEEFAPG